MATVFIPTPLRRLTDGKAKIEVGSGDITSVLADVSTQYPGFIEKLVDDDGNVKRFINVFVNNPEIGTLQGMQTPVSEEDNVSIVPAMAGG